MACDVVGSLRALVSTQPSGEAGEALSKAPSVPLLCVPIHTVAPPSRSCRLTCVALVWLRAVRVQSSDGSASAVVHGAVEHAGQLVAQQREAFNQLGDNLYAVCIAGHLGAAVHACRSLWPAVTNCRDVVKAAALELQTSLETMLSNEARLVEHRRAQVMETMGDVERLKVERNVVEHQIQQARAQAEVRCRCHRPLPPPPRSRLLVGRAFAACVSVQEEAKTLAQAQEQAQSLRAEITRLREERDQAQQVGHDAVCVAAALSCN